MDKREKQYCFTALPEGYAESFKIDLQADKKLALIVNGIGFIIMAVCLAIGCLIVSPIVFVEDFGVITWIALLAAIVVYMVLHELVHGITMKYFGSKKVKYGFTGLYAFAGSEDYYAKVPYIIIALAPIVVWGVVLFVLCLLVPAKWFWFVYFIQVVNISGAAGDLYVSWRFSKLPADILVRDTGIAMTVYTRQ